MYPYNYNSYGQDRFLFAGPFLLGALTGGVAVAAFNPYRPRPMNGPGPYPGPGPYYPRPPYYY